MEKVKTSFSQEIARITLIGDSSCTIASYDSTSWGDLIEEENGAKIEIQLPSESKTKVDRLNHTPGPKNISDLGTRGTATIADIQQDSEWQCGPEYLKEDRSTWPISRGFNREVPVEERKSRSYKLINTLRVLEEKDSRNVYSMVNRASSWDLLRGTMARLLLADKTGKVSSVHVPPTPEFYEKAETALFLLSIHDTKQLCVEGKLDCLFPWWEGGICWTVGR